MKDTTRLQPVVLQLRSYTRLSFAVQDTTRLQPVVLQLPGYTRLCLHLKTRPRFSRCVAIGLGRTVATEIEEPPAKAWSE